MIKLFLTGGTFDKAYNEITEQLEFSQSHINEMLKVSRATLEINTERLLLKDSLTFTPQDRKLIIDACRDAAENNIVITHGTGTMTETAQELKEADLTDKTIVLTGAMVPFSLGTRSDALFNLGNALAFAQVLPPAVYVAMNGRYFEAGQVRKDTNIGVFTDK